MEDSGVTFSFLHPLKETGDGLLIVRSSERSGHVQPKGPGRWKSIPNLISAPFPTLLITLVLFGLTQVSQLTNNTSPKPFSDFHPR
jgi:hypothetical protein